MRFSILCDSYRRCNRSKPESPILFKRQTRTEEYWAFVYIKVTPLQDVAGIVECSTVPWVATWVGSVSILLLYYDPVSLILARCTAWYRRNNLVDEDMGAIDEVKSSDTDTLIHPAHLVVVLSHHQYRQANHIGLGGV